MVNENSTFYLLSTAILISILLGILFPSIGLLVEPYILIWLGLLLFFNLIQLNTNDLLITFKRTKILLLFSLIKLIVIPISLYLIVSLIIYPKPSNDLILAIFLLSGISTGLGSPFVTNYIGAKLPIVVGIIITSSFAVPFILPGLVYILFKNQFSIPIENMILLLSVALFIPLISSNIIKKHFPKLIKKIENKTLFFSMNFAVFAKYSNLFFFNFDFVITNILISFSLFFLYGFIGYFFARFIGLDKRERLSIFIAMSYVNNMLVVVFAQQFFNTQVAALSAFYNIPYYIGILILQKSITSNFIKIK